MEKIFLENGGPDCMMCKEGANFDKVKGNEF